VLRGLAAAAACLALAHAGAAGAQFKSDWQIQQEARNWQETAVSLPPAPKAQDLLEFSVGAATDFRFYIDATSLSVGSDGVVRYVLVARSPSGARNVSYEGIRCESRNYRIYATGRRDGTWTKARRVRWRAIGVGSTNWHAALERDYFCPQGVPIYTAAEGVDALKRGGNPNSRGD
jgi:CNP1-like family